MITALTTTTRHARVALLMPALLAWPLMTPAAHVSAGSYVYVPVISLEPYAARPGQSVAVQGHGFVPGEAVRLEDSPARTYALSDGTFLLLRAYTVPYRARPGYVRLTVIGSQSQQAAWQRLYVLPLQPWVKASTYVVHTGDHVWFDVYGFAAHEAIEAYMGSESLGRSKRTTDTAGHLAQVGPFRVAGDSPAPTYTFVGARSGARLRVALTWLQK